MTQQDVDGLTDDEIYQSWVESIERTAADLGHIYNSRDVFRHVRLMFDTNPQMFRPGTNIYTESSVFVLSWLSRMYAVEVLMFIRREYDTQPGTVNLLKLFSQMKDRPMLMSRRRLRQHYEQWTAPVEVKDELANEHFDSLKHVKGAMLADDYVDPAQIIEDMTSLGRQIDVVREYANRDLAHRTPTWQVPSIGVPDDLDPPLYAILETFNRYYKLLTGKDMGDPTPHISFYWQECLTHVLATPTYFDQAKRGLRAAREATSRAVMDNMVERARKKP